MMEMDLRRDIQLLVSIAKADAAVSVSRSELDRIPARIAEVDKKLAAIAAREAGAVEGLEDLKKRHRALEQALQDNEAQITKYKNQQMQVKTNKEYQAIIAEIGGLQKDIDKKEEELLELMDAIEIKTAENKGTLAGIAEERAVLEKEKMRLEQRADELRSTVERTGSERPKLLKEVSDPIQKRYARLLKTYGDVAVTTMDGESCGGCHTRLPPQVINEIKKNNQLIACEGCGRILVYYVD